MKSPFKISTGSLAVPTYSSSCFVTNVAVVATLPHDSFRPSPLQFITLQLRYACVIWVVKSSLNKLSTNKQFTLKVWYSRPYNLGLMVDNIVPEKHTVSIFRNKITRSFPVRGTFIFFIGLPFKIFSEVDNSVFTGHFIGTVNNIIF